MADTVTVTVLKYHTLAGQEHQPGSSYALEASLVDSLVAQGMVSAPATAPAPAKPSHPVEPMTTEDLHGKPKARK